ncbi:MAG: chromate transporter [Angelakisella sp.]
MIYVLLAWEFFKTGLFSIGGGLATLPFLYQMSDKYAWFTHAELANMLAVSESTPGPIGINMATYVGYTTGGVLGSLIASFSIVLPSVIIIIIIAKCLGKFSENKFVRSGFYGLRPAVCALIAVAGWGVVKMALFDFAQYSQGSIGAVFLIKPLILFAVLLPAVLCLKKHPIVYIAAAAIAGVVFKI